MTRKAWPWEHVAEAPPTLGTRNQKVWPESEIVVTFKACPPVTPFCQATVPKVQQHPMVSLTEKLVFEHMIPWGTFIFKSYGKEIKGTPPPP